MKVAWLGRYWETLLFKELKDDKILNLILKEINKDKEEKISALENRKKEYFLSKMEKDLRDETYSSHIYNNLAKTIDLQIESQERIYKKMISSIKDSIKNKQPISFAYEQCFLKIEKNFLFKKEAYSFISNFFTRTIENVYKNKDEKINSEEIILEKMEKIIEKNDLIIINFVSSFLEDKFTKYLNKFCHLRGNLSQKNNLLWNTTDVESPNYQYFHLKNIERDIENHILKFVLKNELIFQDLEITILSNTFHEYDFLKKQPIDIPHLLLTLSLKVYFQTRWLRLNNENAKKDLLNERNSKKFISFNEFKNKKIEMKYWCDEETRKDVYEYIKSNWRGKDKIIISFKDYQNKEFLNNYVPSFDSPLNIFEKEKKIDEMEKSFLELKNFENVFLKYKGTSRV